METVLQGRPAAEFSEERARCRKDNSLIIIAVAKNGLMFGVAAAMTDARSAALKTSNLTRAKKWSRGEARVSVG
jgi:hypothetical protein